MKWQGPHEIVEVLAPTTFRVRLIGNPDAEIKPVSWNQVRRFAGKDVDLPVNIKEAAQREAQAFIVKDLLDVRMIEGTAHVLVSWSGFDSSYDSWEPLDQLYRDIGNRVLKYVAKNKKDDPELCSEYSRVRKIKR